MKKAYQAVHIGSALAYLGFTAAAEYAEGQLGGILCATVGLAAFLLFCLLQLASGLYFGNPRTCLLPQAAKDRGTAEAPKWVLPAHRWANNHLTLLGRISMTIELSAFTLVAISQVLGSMRAVARNPVCLLCRIETGAAYFLTAPAA